MVDESHIQLHPDVLAAVRDCYPRLMPIPPNVLNRIAAYADNDYRPDVSQPTYQILLQLKVRFAVEGWTRELHYDIGSLRSTVAKAYHRSSADKDSELGFIYEEVKQFALLVMTVDELPVLESLLLKTLNDEEDTDLLVADANERSRCIRKLLSNPMIDWYGLPNPLMCFVVEEFRDHLRVDPFWERIQQEVAPYFHQEAIDNPDYRKLLRLQIRYRGFRESAAVIAPLAEALLERLGQSDVSHDKSRQEILRQLTDLIEETQRPPRHLGRG